MKYIPKEFVYSLYTYSQINLIIIFILNNVKLNILLLAFLYFYICQSENTAINDKFYFSNNRKEISF